MVDKGMNILINNSDKKLNVIPSNIALRKYIQYFNIIFPPLDIFKDNYTLMPNADGTLSLAFDGNRIFAELWGAALSPILLGTEPNNYTIPMLIQLSPYGAYQITRQNQAEFTDKRLFLADIDLELFYALHQAFVSSNNVTDLVYNCENVLHKRIEKQIVSNSLRLATKAVSDSHGQIKVNEIARNSGYSERQLNRMFITQIGMNIKKYSRLIRFNFVLKNIQKSPLYFAEIAQQAGFFDQAHFDKDFKAISRVSPQEYLKTMSDFYYDGNVIYDMI
jgi:AraC-like DNA-binding protein